MTDNDSIFELQVRLDAWLDERRPLDDFPEKSFLESAAAPAELREVWNDAVYLNALLERVDLQIPSPALADKIISRMDGEPPLHSANTGRHCLDLVLHGAESGATVRKAEELKGGGSRIAAVAISLVGIAALILFAALSDSLTISSPTVNPSQEITPTIATENRSTTNLLEPAKNRLPDFSASKSDGIDQSSMTASADDSPTRNSDGLPLDSLVTEVGSAYADLARETAGVFAGTTALLNPPSQETTHSSYRSKAAKSPTMRWRDHLGSIFEAFAGDSSAL